MKLGRYIVIEGHDGTGKSTQVSEIRKKLLDRGIDSIEFHEPAGSSIADAIRTIIKNGDLERDALTNMLLFNAARHDIWTNKAIPALKNGKWVITARNFYSTLAYQGYGEGLDLDLIETVTHLSTDERYMNPDFATILDLDDETERARRIGERGKLNNPDTFESKNNTFQSIVRMGYMKIAQNRKIPIISANHTVDKVTDKLWLYIKQLI